ncbi:hypothetical protein HYU13_02350 [Candidatus Woesearchaeota archaeon]|nr:hypothetical protein [Candidatus Woesearchaeota archaeon]
MKDTPVKIDAELKKKIEQVISDGDMRFEYPSVKNFIDKAVLQLLHEIEKRGKDGRK